MLGEKKKNNTKQCRLTVRVRVSITRSINKYPQAEVSR